MQEIFRERPQPQCEKEVQLYYFFPWSLTAHKLLWLGLQRAGSVSSLCQIQV